MNQAERRVFLIEKLLAERPSCRRQEVPKEAARQRVLLRGLLNVRPAGAVGAAFAEVQDAYLQQELAERGIVRLEELTPVDGDLYLWQGDITRLRCGAIVNAANSGMTGCYVPNHACIDNCIHTFAGVRLRYKCGQIMQAQGHEEPTGKAKITPAYNLPCDYVIHTVGPIVDSILTDEHCRLLESSYKSCLEIAIQNNVKSIAFCCISTGVFGFPQEKAAEIAVRTVREFRKNHDIQVIFNVFNEDDHEIYKRLLGGN